MASATAASAPAAWASLLHELVVSEPPSEQAYSEKVGELVAQFRGSTASAGRVTPIIRLVEALGPFLTSEDDAPRARATRVLAEVAEAVPEAVGSPGEVRHLADFFTARLTDWPALRGALRGCLALVCRRPAPAPASAPTPATEPAAAVEPRASQQLLPVAPQDEEVVQLMRVCVSHVFIRALAQPDRAAALRLLGAAVQRYGDALLAANLDLLEYLIASVDGEKDPRCLLLCFEATQHLLHLYHRQPKEALCWERLEESAEELFEVLACYFPVTFTPPPGDANRITREDLAAGLQASLAAEPLFAPFLVPLAMEKLSSALRQAKLDSLSLLAACAASYGPTPLASHISTLWCALRVELAAPAAEGLLAADAAAADEMAAAAADCLARCLAAFQRGACEGTGEGSPADDAMDAVPAGQAASSLADAVLADPSMQDMLACIRSPGLDASLHRRSALRARAGARAAQALCCAGGAAAGRALAQLLPPLLDVLGQRRRRQQQQEGAGGGQASGNVSLQSQCLGWAATVELLQAAAASPIETAAGAGADPGAGPAAQNAGAAGGFSLDAALLQGVVAAASAALASAADEQAAAAAAAAAAEPMELDAAGRGEEQEEEQQQPMAGRWLWALADCTPQHSASLQLEALAAVFAAPHLAALLPSEQVEAAVGSILRMLTAPGGLLAAPQRQAAAVAPLTALAGSCHSSVLAGSALPALVAAAGQQGSAVGALAALQALASASGSLQAAIVQALDKAIQQQLPTAVAGAAGGAAAASSGGAAGDGRSSAGAAPQQQVLLQLLQAAAAIVAASPREAGPLQGPLASAEAEAGAGASAAAVQLAEHLLEVVQQLPPAAAAAAAPTLQAGCAELAYQAMRAAAATGSQQPLAAAAAGALLEGQPVTGLQACLACALLVPLRPEAVAALPGGPPGALVQQLVQLSLSQQPQQEEDEEMAEDEEEAPLGRLAALAAAAMLNKWPADADSLSACVSVTLQGQLYPACGLAAPIDSTEGSGTAGPAASPAAWRCLAAVTRALAMRGHREAEAAVSRVVACLASAAQRGQEQEREQRQGEGAEAEAAAAAARPAQEAAAAAAADAVPPGPGSSEASGLRAAARLLGAVLDGASGGGSSAGVGRQSFATARPLWQQRMYTAATRQLLPLLQSSMEAAAAAACTGNAAHRLAAVQTPRGGSSLPQEPQPALAAPPLLLALAHVLQSAPAGALQQDQARLLPWMLQALAALQGGPLGGDAELLQALLLLLSTVLMSDAGRQQAEAELLPRLVPVLLSLVQYRPTPAVRETALQCLLLLLELRYASLHPYRREVAAVLAVAVDDNRRSVRLQAARVRQAWSTA